MISQMHATIKFLIMFTSNQFIHPPFPRKNGKFVMPDGGDTGAGRGGKLSKKDRALPLALSRCTSQPPLLECSLQLLSAAQLSGKVHKDSNPTIAVSRFTSLWKSRHPMPPGLLPSRHQG